jgi:predicted DNA binding CopG/RHH family protein
MGEEEAARSGPVTVIRSLDDIPRFHSEEEAAAYWQTHELSEELWGELPDPANVEFPSMRPRTRSIAVRFDESTLARLKALAARRHKGYQTLLKEFVIERLYEEEKREGLVG